MYSRSENSQFSDEIELEERASLINADDTFITIYEENFFERKDTYGNLISNDIFNELSSWLPYIQDLSNLSQTSKKLQKMVAKTDSGKLANAFYQEPPYLNSFWANPITYTVVITTIGFGTGLLSGVATGTFGTLFAESMVSRSCRMQWDTPRCKSFAETSDALIFGSAAAISGALGGASGGTLAFRFASRNSAQKAYQAVGLFKQAQQEYLQDLATKKVLLSKPYSAPRI